MRIVYEGEDIDEAVVSAKREAQVAFGNATVFLARPRDQVDNGALLAVLENALEDEE